MSKTFSVCKSIQDNQWDCSFSKVRGKVKLKVTFCINVLKLFPVFHITVREGVASQVSLSFGIERVSLPTGEILLGIFV